MDYCRKLGQERGIQTLLNCNPSYPSPYTMVANEIEGAHSSSRSALSADGGELLVRSHDTIEVNGLLNLSPQETRNRGGTVVTLWFDCYIARK